MTEIPTELITKAYEALSIARDSGKVRKGTNEATKVIERGQALLVAYASDVSPPEIVAHLPILCEEKNIPCIQVAKREELGKAAGLSVPTAAAAILDAGDGKKALDDLVAKLKTLSGKKEAPKKEAEEKPKEEEKPEETKEEKTEEKPAEKEEPKEEVKAEKEEPEEKPEETKEAPAEEEKPKEE